MTVYNFAGFVEGVREGFRGLLREGYEQDEMKDFLKKCLDLCTNDFEEQTLSENLQEELKDYLEEAKAA